MWNQIETYQQHYINCVCLLCILKHWYPVQAMIPHETDKPNVSRKGRKTADWWSELQYELLLRRERCSARNDLSKLLGIIPLKAFWHILKPNFTEISPSPAVRYPADTLHFFSSDKPVWLCKCVWMSVRIRLAFGARAAAAVHGPDSQVLAGSVYWFTVEM